MRGLVALALVSGCDATFRLDQLPAPPDAPDASTGIGVCEADCECDGFDGDRLDQSRWDSFTFAGIGVTAADRLLIDMRPVASFAEGAEGGLRLVGMRNMIGGRIEIEVPQVIGGTNDLTENYIRLAAAGDPGNGYVIRYGGGVISFMTRVDGVYNRHRERVYDPVLDRFWRISNTTDQSMVRFETRESAVVPWTMATEVEAKVSLANMQILVVAGTYNGGDPNPGVVEYDNFALCGAAKL